MKNYFSLPLIILLLYLPGSCKKSAPPDAGLLSFLDWKGLPVISNFEYQQFSSYDRKKRLDYTLVDPGNKDFNNFIAVCGERPEVIYMEQDGPELCDDGIEGYLIARVDGKSGYVSRIWLTSMPPYTGEVIKIYVDDLKSPIYTGLLSDWFAGTDSVFSEPLAGWHSGAVTSYLPISFNKSLRILLDDLNPAGIYYYHVDIQLIDRETAPFDPERFKNEYNETLKAFITSSGNPDSELSYVILNKGFMLEQNKPTEILNQNGPGTIKEVLLSFSGITIDELNNIILEISWDALSYPSVNLPLSAFFGCQFSLINYSTLPINVFYNGNLLVLSAFFPMPFNSGALIKLINNNPKDISVSASIGFSEALPEEEWGYFHAVYNEVTAPVPENSLYPVLSVSGWGKYIGTFMFLEGHNDAGWSFSDAFNFLEGDESGIIDGELRIPGTGTEDYFNGGFYFVTGTFDHAFGGINYRWRSEDNKSGKVSVYRWHILSDGINFDNNFELKFEYGADKPSLADRYASVAYFYLK